MVYYMQGGPLGQLCFGYKTAEPGQVQRSEYHSGDFAVATKNRIAEVDRGLAVNSADLVFAHGESSVFKGMLKIEPIGNIDEPPGRKRTAKYIAVGFNRSKVAIKGEFLQELGEALVAELRTLPAHFWKLSKHRQDLMRCLDQPPFVGRGEPGDPDRVLLGFNRIESSML